MTGGTSGFGRRALEMILARPEWRVILLARRSERTEELKRIYEDSGRLAIVEADLASLSSLSAAIADVEARLNGRPIDAMALNAGIQTVAGDQQSADGLELTFAVNHLAHFLMADRLGPHIRDGGRIVFTASEVHDPEAFCLMGITRASWQDPALLADARLAQAHYEKPVDRGEARYCASKLLNIHTVRHLARSVPRFSTIAFNPSVVPGTDIARDRNVIQILAWKYVMPAVAPILPGARSVERSAGDLVWLLTEADARSHSGSYVNGRTVEAGSADSRDPEKLALTVSVSRRLLAPWMKAPRAGSQGAVVRGR
ncbi:MAG TPA: SDR family NAD(P)-dependent oxidoreductase [Hyphomicrobiaceae bacterium]|nr:SDR family NAD(P)-dependent oxidoreductase [Hyphomicrobiaceae bacterium]